MTETSNQLTLMAENVSNQNLTRGEMTNNLANHVWTAILWGAHLTGNGNGLLFHMTQSTSRSTIKAIACSKPTISEH